MKTLNLSENTSSTDIVQAAEREDVVVMRDVHAVALIVAFDDDDLDWYVRERDPNFLASITRARDQVRTGRTLSHEDLKRELGLH